MCEAPGFTTAGGHFNPEAKKHGLENPEGHHAGDMQNFTVAADGTAKAKVTDDSVTLTDGPHSLFTGGGTALVIHAAADDMKSDPAGNAGARIACGVIVKSWTTTLYWIRSSAKRSSIFRRRSTRRTG
jgi:Cu-Zn family superoxide dismutase